MAKLRLLDGQPEEINAVVISLERKPTFRDPQQAFADAIKQGRLSADYRLPNGQHNPLYAGDFMYMGTWDGLDEFKNSVSREYLPSKVQS